MLECYSISHNGSNNSWQYRSFGEEDLKNLNTLAYGIFGTAVVVFGVIGNILNIIVLTRPSLHGITYTYLTFLAVSDLVTLLLSLTCLIRFQNLQSTSWITAVYYSYIELPLVNAFMACSVFLVVLLTIERYVSVCHPMKFKAVHNSRWIKRSITGSYLISFIIYLPVCFEKFPVEVGHGYFVSCENAIVVNSTLYQTYLVVKEFVVRLGPVLVLALLNIGIICSFCSRRRKCHRRYGSSSSFRRHMAIERRLIVLCGTIVASFFVCVIPAAGLTLLHSEEKDYQFDFQVFRAVANVLELSNYALNFYLYCLVSSEIRTTLLGLFGKLRYF